MAEAAEEAEQPLTQEVSSEVVEEEAALPSAAAEEEAVVAELLSLARLYLKHWTTVTTATKMKKWRVSAEGWEHEEHVI